MRAVDKLVPVQQHRIHTPAWPSAGIGERPVTHPGTSSWTPTFVPLNEQFLLDVSRCQKHAKHRLIRYLPFWHPICPNLCVGVYTNLFLQCFFVVVLSVRLQCAEWCRCVDRYQQRTHFFMNTGPVSLLVVRVTTHTHTFQRLLMFSYTASYKNHNQTQIENFMQFYN